MVWRVKEAFSFDDPRGGYPVTLRVGTLLEENDPRVKGHEQCLEPAEKAAARQVVTAVSAETASAAPGELRTLTTPQGDLEALRRQAEGVGVTVDKRWKADRLRQEIAAKSEE